MGSSDHDPFRAQDDEAELVGVAQQLGAKIELLDLVTAWNRSLGRWDAASVVFGLVVGLAIGLGLKVALEAVFAGVVAATLFYKFFRPAAGPDARAYARAAGLEGWLEELPMSRFARDDLRVVLAAEQHKVRLALGLPSSADPVDIDASLRQAK